MAQHTLEVTVEWTPVDLTGIDALGSLTSLVIYGRCYDVWSDQYAPCDSSSFSIPAWPANLLSLRLDRGTWPSLPPFPAGLTQLSLDITGMSTIPPLPDGLIGLSLVDKPSLAALPGLPGSLLRLFLTSAGHPLPDLPPNLDYLDLKGAPGISIPPLPNSLDTIRLAYFNDPAIPAWPDASRLIQLYSMPNLVQVPEWPSTLMSLSLWSTDALPSLHAFPPGLENIIITTGGLDPIPPALDSLPPWPNNIRTIFLASMPFTELPPFPEGLLLLDLSYLHELTCLPVLPASLGELRIDVDGLPLDPTSINCLPNFPPEATIYWGFGQISHDPDLLCTALNSDCPFLNPVATGTAYWDQNTNGVRDPGEPGYPYVTLHLQPGNAMHGVASDGTYAWAMSVGEYTLSADAGNPYVQDITPTQHPLAFTNQGEVLSGKDFGVVLQPNVQDLRIDLTGPWGQPGFDSYGTITCENVGTMAVDATVTFQLDAVQDWVGATPPPATVDGNTIQWGLASLQVGEQRQIHLTVHTDADIAIGTPLVQWAEIGPVADDANQADNVSTFTSEVFGSYDPNDKQVRPAALPPAIVAAGSEELIYTVRFQNTGTWPAVKVQVVDSLSQDLQWPTFRMISSSHPCVWELSDAGVLSFLFDPINLPDSIADEPRSHGFVKFAIKPATTLVSGSLVPNVANIYFDFNAPVATQAAIFSVEEGTGVAGSTPRTIRVRPNPAQDMLWVDLDDPAPGVVEICDALGRRWIRQETFTGRAIDVPVGSLAPGPYILRHTAMGRSLTVRFMKQ